MKRITGKAEEETLIELQSATDSQTGGDESKILSLSFEEVLVFTGGFLYGDKLL